MLMKDPKEKAKKLPDFSFEQIYWDKGYKFVAGADEVGRGAFAGPVVAAAVVFPWKIRPEVEINDSKRLSLRQRLTAARWIKGNAAFYGIAAVGSGLINRYGIVPATRQAIAKACDLIKCKIDHVLVDGKYRVGELPIAQTPIIKGDQLSMSIAAASILAKVYRDDLMCALATKEAYSMYGWERNAGYGTRHHCEAIKKYGSCKLHRRLFIRKYL